MKKFNKFSLTLSIICLSLLATTSIAFASYMIAELTYNDFTSSDLISNDNSRLHQIIFKDGSTQVGELYVKPDSEIDLSDVPYLFNSNNELLEWKDSSGSTKISLTQSFTPTSDTTLTASVVSKTDLNSAVNVESGSGVSVSSNSVTINQTTSSGTSNIVSISGNIDKTITSQSYDAFGSNNVFADLSDKESFFKPDRKNQASGNNTIGLSDNTLANKINLSGDLVITNSTFNISAWTGFYNSYDYSQRNFQGYIIGSYTQLDLCGNNLIVGNGATLNAYGQIVDSVGGGKIIVEKGGILKSTFVVEDHVHERHTPVIYAYGGSIFSMYRMAYLNCDIEFRYGSSAYGVLRMDFGGNNDNFYDGELKLIGTDSSSYIQMNSNKTNGYILREYAIDAGVQSAISGNTFCKNNVLDQKYKYIFNDLDITINPPKFNISFTSVGITLKFDINFGKGNNFIPPYFDFYLYKTKVTLKATFTFLPGSYLYVDSKSIINLSGDSSGHFQAPSLISGKFTAHYYQAKGGLNFASQKRYFNDAVTSKDKGWCLGRDSKDGGLYGVGNNIIYSNTKVFWGYLNRSKPSYCDMEGSFTFDDNYTSTTTNDKKYMLGGNINIANIEDFKNVVNSRNDVYLYGSTAKIGPCGSYGGLYKFDTHIVGVTDYFISPLISDGNVLTNMNDKTKVREDYATSYSPYSTETGLVNYGGKYYAFMTTTADGTSFNNDNSGHVNKSNYGNDENAYRNGLDSCYGTFVEVTNNSASHSVIWNKTGETYVYYRGIFLPFTYGSLSSSTVNMNKMSIQAVGNRTITWKTSSTDNYYGHGAWWIL